MKLYGIFSGILAALFGVLSLPIAAVSMAHEDLAIAIAFLIMLVALVPTIATVGKLELMDDDDPRFEGGKENRKIVTAAYPDIFQPIYVILVMCFGAWCLLPIHPCYVFYCAVCSLSSYWFIYFYPRAKRLLGDK